MEEIMEGLRFMKFEEDAGHSGEDVLNLGVNLFNRESKGRFYLHFSSYGSYEGITANLNSEELRQLGEWLLKASE